MMKPKQGNNAASPKQSSAPPRLVILVAAPVSMKAAALPRLSTHLPFLLVGNIPNPLLPLLNIPSERPICCAPLLFNKLFD